jgi:L-cystine transport system permease protein
MFPKVLTALPTTLLIVLVATIIGILFGILLAFVRLERIPGLNQVAICFVSFIRGTPILIQMFIVYFGLPPLLRNIGIDISTWDKIYFIFVTYGINTGAYFSEIFRSSILSVPKTQMDAARSVGLSRASTYKRIIIPQSIPIAIPGVGVMMTNLLQDSSLAFAFGILDVIGKARTLGQLRNRSIEGYIVSAVIFTVLAIGIEKSFALLEKRNRGNVQKSQ